MPYGKRPRLGRLDLLIIGASKDKLQQQDIPAVDTPSLTDEQQDALHRLQYRRRVSTLTPAEEMQLQRLLTLRKGK